MAYRTKAFVFVVFCMLVISTLFAATTANVVATEGKEETNYVADVNTGVANDLKEHTIGLTGEVAKDLDMETLEEEKHRRYGRHRGRRYGHRYHHRRGHGHHHCHYPHC
ncbi:hypothetical protein ZOSMA_262G00040 [Zostera marina]|uniref:Glycine-rich protein n=1 Tax=Zostera marina TaxID=29655 RepID=A0A0K9PH57_ZOSMR|nr:hypothetical protein ZOSMA_262G00040 [Zostera marina]